MPITQSEATCPAGQQIAECLVASGHLSAQQLQHATRVGEKVPGRSLSALLIELGYCDTAAIRATLRTGHVVCHLGELLVELGMLSEADLALALAIQHETPNLGLADVLTENHMVDGQAAFSVLADLMQVTHVYPEHAVIEPDLFGRVPARTYETHGFLPLHRQDGAVVVAFSDPQNQRTVDLARRHFGNNLQVGLSPRRAVLAAIARAAQEAGRRVTEVSPVVDIVNEIIQAALTDQASDIHFEPLPGRMRVRFRQDGSLLPHRELTSEEGVSVLSRIKVMAGADIAERRRHQDGRILYHSPRGPIDMRMSVYVTVHGEKAVLRILNNRETLLTIDDIGMAPRMARHFREDVLDAPSGVVIVTGPTGSGKTTTLYAAVNHLNDARTSIVTAEEPVEAIIEGISQCSINPKINLSYEESLRHIVRQDPDVIVIGEVRDRFSAEVAINAALTGHKVLTTFHTEDSIGGLIRLMNMNIEAFLISSTVVSVVAQRLLRRVCTFCAEDHVLTGHELRRLGYVPAEAEGLTFRRGRGCQHCRHTGYRGRVAVFELLVLNEAVRDAVLARRTAYEIRRVGLETGELVTLLEDGVAKACQGLTTFSEILRQLPRLNQPRPAADLLRVMGVSA